MKIIRARVGERNDVPDVYQEVCIAIWQGISSLKNRSSSLDWDSSVKAWMTQVARNKCADYWRSKQRRDVPHCDEEMKQFGDEISLAEFNLGELYMEADEAIAELSPIYREVVELHYKQRWSIAEIALEKNLPDGTVKWRLHEARKQLREYFA